MANRTLSSTTKSTLRAKLHKPVALATAAVVGLATLTVHAPAAHAEEVSSTGKGVVGGALLGGEVVVIVESLAGVRPTWAYLAGFGVGAVGGGVGGYFIEQSSTNGRVPTYMLAGGLALAIPALVLSLNATRYRPDATATEDRAPKNAPAADPGVVGGSAVIGGGGGYGTTPPSMPPPQAGGAGTPTPSSGPGTGTTPNPTPTPPPAAPGTPHVPLSLIDVHEGTFRLGLPVPDVHPMYSTRELKTYGMAQQTEVRMPLVDVTF